MTPESIAATVGLVLSLSLAYIPGLKDWYNPLTSEIKVFVTGLLLVGIAAGTLAFNCHWATACITADWGSALTVLIAALVANQSTYVLAVRPFKSEA